MPELSQVVDMPQGGGDTGAVLLLGYVTEEGALGKDVWPMAPRGASSSTHITMSYWAPS